MGELTMGMSFTIQVGYRSGFLLTEAHDQSMIEATQLRGIINAIIEHPMRWFDETMKTTTPYVNDEHTIDDFIDIYKDGDGWNPIKLKEDGAVIMCSGSAESRQAKEHVAAAFCRLVMIDAHKAGFHVNIITT